MAQEVEIIIKATDKASSTLKTISSKFQDIGKSLTSVGSALTKGVTLPIAAATAGMVALAKEGASLEGVRKAFNGLSEAAGTSGKAMLKALQESAAGMISNRDLMQSFNKAAQLVSLDFASKLPDAMKYLQKVAAATGQDMNYMLDSLVTGVGRLSPMILDNLAIQVSLEQATERAAQMFGVEADQLTKAQQQAGMMDLVLEKLKTNTASMPDVAGTAAAGFAGLTTMLQNARDEIGVKLLPVITPLIERLIELANNVLPIVTGAIERFTALSPSVQNMVMVFVALAAALGPVLIIVGQVTTAIGAIMPVITAVAGVITGPLILAIAAIIATIAAWIYIWKENIQTALEVFNTVKDFLMPIFEALANLITAVVGLAVRVLTGLWQNVLLPALQRVGDYLEVKLGPLFRMIADYLNNTFGPIMNKVKSWIDKVRSAFGGLANAVANVANWIKRLANMIANLRLPDWLQTNSPTPFEMGLRGINAELVKLAGKNLPELSAKLNIAQPAGLSNAAAMATTNNNNYNLTINEAGSRGDVVSDFSLLQALAGA